MHLESCLVELALGKHKLASLLQRARRISLWETKRVIRGKGPCSASYYLSVSQSHFLSVLSVLYQRCWPCTHMPTQRGQVTWTHCCWLSSWHQLGTSIPDSFSVLLCQPWQLYGSQPTTPQEQKTRTRKGAHSTMLSKDHMLWNQKTRVQILTLPHIRCVALSTFLNILNASFCSFLNEGNDIFIYEIIVSCEWGNIWEALSTGLAHRKHSINKWFQLLPEN